MRKLMWFTLGFGASCALGAYLFWDGFWLLLIPSVFVMGLAFWMKGKWKFLRPVAAVALGVAVGVLWLLGYDAVHLQNARKFDGKTEILTAVASDYSYETAYGSAVEGKLSLGGRAYSAVIYLPHNVSAEPGDTISGSFRLRYTPGGLENATYHRGNGVFLLAYPTGLVEVSEAERVPLRYYPAVLRKNLIQTINDTFPADTGFFARALLLGDRTDVDYVTSTSFKVSGISHIIAVSGLHVAILFSVVYLFTGKRRLLTAFIGIPVVLLFAAVAGFSPSITRASLMQILMMLALLFDKEYDPATALAFACLVMLSVNPMVITSVSFQLSVGCMAGIFLFSARIRAWLESFRFWRKWKGKSLKMRFRTWLCSGISVTLSAMFFTTPLVAYYFGAVSLVGILTNLLTLWLITFIFYGIMAVCLLAYVWQWAGTALAWGISWLIRYVLLTAKALAAFPLAAVYTKSVYIVIWLVLCYILLFLFLFAKKRQPYVLICCGIIGLCVALGLSWAEPLVDNCRMTVFDVGQGQCVLLQSGGKNYLIDCGGDSDTAAADIAAETLLSQGIAHLDGIVVTHYDRDHAGGVAYLLSRIPADGVFLPETVDEDGMMQSILEGCHGAQVMVTTDLNLAWGDSSLRIFAPVLSGSGNESGLSVLFSGENCDILITGDMSTLGERLLLRKQLPELTALVVGHHGSDSSTGEALLAATTPEYAFISVGENSYGHPDPEVLERLRAIDCKICRTDQNGTIIFRR
ncbi:MAG: DNA internalization-related competence protein ComEC/Rec2 [Oscillospiraceae bacterium]|nr:DNA internalization-related competence protein ComEC/Rec2 [Oscillospiraceae bacterium]